MRNRRRKDPFREQSGVILVLAAIVMSVLVLLVVLSITSNEWTHFRGVVRTAASGASVEASSALCSTRSCWNQALINALRSLQRYPLRGQSSAVAFSAGVQAAIDDLYQQLQHGTKYISGPAGKNEWSFDGVSVQIQRGRWWPRGVDGMPPTVDQSTLLPAKPISSEIRGVRYEPRFESFDRFDNTNWQSLPGNQGTPNYIAANAARVAIRVPQFRSAVDYVYIPNPQFSSATITARNKDMPELMFCAAPFAIPACSLVDNDGEYEPGLACQFDRFFTSEKRYCTAAQLAAGTCDVLPGSWYSPITEIVCDQTKPSYSKAKCECVTSALAQASTTPANTGYYGASPPGWVGGRTIDAIYNSNGDVRGGNADQNATRVTAPCSQEFGQNSQECSFFPWPKLDQTADHFGVVGTSPNAHDALNHSVGDPQDEESYRSILNGGCSDLIWDSPTHITSNDNPGNVSMTVGDPFAIKRNGLEDQQTDGVAWNAIWGSSAYDTYRRYPTYHPVYDEDPPDFLTSFARKHPRLYDPGNKIFGPNGFVELGIPWVMGRVDDARGYPYGRTKTFVDQLIANGYIEPYEHYGESDSAGSPKQALEPYHCNKLGVPQHGTCNSHRTIYNNVCQTKKRWYVPDGRQITLSGKDYRQNPGQNNSNQTPDAWQFLDPVSGTWKCDEVPPYMPCPLVGLNPKGTSSDDIPRDPHDPTNPLTDDVPNWAVRVWQPRIPVIADMSANAKPCTGINGSVQPDPWVDPTHDWRIVGFVRANLFDSDIGYAPPKPPGPSWITYWTNVVGVTFANLPTTCDYEHADVDANGRPDRQPWAFNPTYQPPNPANPSGAPLNAGADANCNMVRGRIACDPGLIAGDYSGLSTDPKLPPSIVSSE